MVLVLKFRQYKKIKMSSSQYGFSFPQCLAITVTTALSIVSETVYVYTYIPTAPFLYTNGNILSSIAGFFHLHNYTNISYWYIYI